MEDTLDLLLEALNSAYKDGTRPGVLISKVNKGKRKFYASIQRYPSGPQERVIVASATGDTRSEAVAKLAKTWIENHQKSNPIDALRAHVSDFDKFPPDNEDDFGF